MTDFLKNTYLKEGNHVSFELFPPKSTKGLKQIYQTIAKLKEIKPDFFSVTYGAGGSTAEKSLEIASAIQNLAEVCCVAHFTCVGMNKLGVKELIDGLRLHGINHIIALRGDKPKGADHFPIVEDGFKYASELLEYIRGYQNSEELGVFVAGYTEGHNENPSKENDFRNLVHKIRQGADGIVTQLFFENESIYEFRDKLKNEEIEIPIAAGIFPISNAGQIKRILELSGAKIPKTLADGLEKYSDNPDEMLKFGTDFAINQIEDLLKNGIRYFHFYTMNKHEQTLSILKQLRSRFPNLNF